MRISHYTPTKAAILSLMHSSAVALGKYNIRCNAVLPGTIMTDINKEDLSDKAKYEGMVKRTALGRLGGGFICSTKPSSLLTSSFQLPTILQDRSSSCRATLRSILRGHLYWWTVGFW